MIKKFIAISFLFQAGLNIRVQLSCSFKEIGQQSNIATTYTHTISKRSSRAQLQKDSLTIVVSVKSSPNHAGFLFGR